MIHKTSYLVVALLANCCVCLAQGDLESRYAQFSSSAREEFRQKADSNLVSFATTLSKNWETFRLCSENARRRMMPPVIADTLGRPQSDNRVDISGVLIEDLSQKETNSLNLNGYDETPVFSGTRKLEFRFFEYPVFVNVPLSYSQVTLKDTKEKSVAETWDDLVRLDNGALLCDLHSVISRLALNDWGGFELADACAKALFREDTNLQTVAAVYFLNSLGLDCKVARAGKSLVTVFRTKQPVYGKKYIVTDGDQYYVSGNLPDYICDLQTYKMPSAANLRPMNLEVSTPPAFEQSSNVFENNWHTDILEDDIHFSFSGCLINFYASYPQTSFPVYAKAAPDEGFSGSLLQSLSVKTNGLNQVETLGLILKMMHSDFAYKTDTEQFGFEKVFFFEENFQYSYNDCEDRAVLFSHLVRSLLGLDVILLEYSDHVNCAVAVEGVDKGMYVNLRGRKFYVCDPAYIGASIGMSLEPSNVKPEKIWVL